MVADEVDDLKILLAVAAPQPTPELLQEDHRRLRGSQHQDGVHRWHVEAFVEDVHRAHDVEVTRLQPRDRGMPGCAGLAAVDRHRPDAPHSELLRHEVRVQGGDTER